MEDDRRAVLGEHLAHALVLLAVGEHGDGVEHVAVLDELAPDREEVVLGVVEQHQLARADARDLAAQLGADRAAGAGDEHDAAGEVAADAVELHPHRLAAEHVLDLDLAHLAHEPRRRVCSSSKTVGIVRTGTPRSRQAATTGARTVPGADGIAMITSSGSTSSSTLGRAPRSCRARDSPRSIRAPCLRGSSSTKPTGRSPRSGLRMISRSSSRPPSPAPTIRTERASRRARKPRERPLVEHVDQEARAADEHEHQQPVEHEHAGRDVDRDEAAVDAVELQPRLHDGHVGEQRRASRRRTACAIREVVALRRVAHPVPVEAEQREDEHAAHDGEPDRPLEQVGVAAGSHRRRSAARRPGSRRARPAPHPPPPAAGCDGGTAGRPPGDSAGASAEVYPRGPPSSRPSTSRSVKVSGSRRTRSAGPPAGRLTTSTSSGALEPLEPALGDQPLVDGAEPPLERRPHGRAERHRLAVHRAARGHDEVRVGDQRLRVDGALRDHEAARARELLPLLRRAREHDDLRAARAAARAGRRTAGARSGGRARRQAACARSRAAPRRRAPSSSSTAGSG